MSTPKMGNKSTFVKITNQNIYDELLIIKEHVIRTNGKVKLNKWLASTAMVIALLVAGLKMNGVI